MTGTPDFPFPIRPRNADYMSLENAFDFFGVHLDGPAAVDLGHHVWDWRFPDIDAQARVELSNRTLHGCSDSPLPAGAAVVTCPRTVLGNLITTGEPIADAIDRGDIGVERDDTALRTMWSLMTTFEMFYAIIEP